MDNNNNTNDNFANLTDPESVALKNKLGGRERQMKAEEMGGIQGKVEELRGKLEERSADKKLADIDEAANDKNLAV